MEQVFGIANQLLSRDESTRSRSLAIRTYKVIPLNADAGLLEFVENSQAIGEWLVPAHDL
jgi:ataxia telangiectasia mutated family protein